MPSRGARTGSSIFMASSTSRTSPCRDARCRARRRPAARSPASAPSASLVQSALAAACAAGRRRSRRRRPRRRGTPSACRRRPPPRRDAPRSPSSANGAIRLSARARTSDPSTRTPSAVAATRCSPPKASRSSSVRSLMSAAPVLEACPGIGGRRGRRRSAGAAAARTRCDLRSPRRRWPRAAAVGRRRQLGQVLVDEAGVRCAAHDVADAASSRDQERDVGADAEDREGAQRRDGALRAAASRVSRGGDRAWRAAGRSGRRSRRPRRRRSRRGCPGPTARGRAGAGRPAAGSPTRDLPHRPGTRSRARAASSDSCVHGSGSPAATCSCALHQIDAGRPLR